ncbi:MAG: rRNA adenine N-6-methyltransferase family protein [Balneolales bacterium]
MLDQNLSPAGRDPVKILEVGAGTGVFTGYILNHLRPDDHLDVVEIDEHFHNIINKNYKADNLHTHNCDFLDFDCQHKYDYIFSSIPYEQLPPEVSEKIWKRKLSVCMEGTYITYYKYVNITRFRCKFEKQVVNKYRSDERIVFRNVPPASVFTLQINNIENENFLKELA